MKLLARVVFPAILFSAIHAMGQTRQDIYIYDGNNPNNRNRGYTTPGEDAVRLNQQKQEQAKIEAARAQKQKEAELARQEAAAEREARMREIERKAELEKQNQIEAEQREERRKLQAVVDADAAKKLQDTVAEQQRMIDELKKQLDEMKNAAKPTPQESAKPAVSAAP